MMRIGIGNMLGELANVPEVIAGKIGKPK